jgi:fatty acid-binding protein DegV
MTFKLQSNSSKMSTFRICDNPARRFLTATVTVIDTESVAVAIEEALEFIFDSLLERARNGKLNPEQIPAENIQAKDSCPEPSIQPQNTEII